MKFLNDNGCFGIEKSFCNTLEQVLLIAAAVQTAIFISVHCRCCCCACIRENAHPKCTQFACRVDAELMSCSWEVSLITVGVGYLDLAF